MTQDVNVVTRSPQCEDVKPAGPVLVPAPNCERAEASFARDDAEVANRTSFGELPGISGLSGDHGRATKPDEREHRKEIGPGESKKPTVRSRLFLHDVALTMCAEASTVISNLLVASILSRGAGARALSQYLLVRRVLSWVVAAALLGLVNGLPRFVAHATGHAEHDEPAYFLAASICMIPSALIVGGLMIVYREICARWLFGDVQETGIVVALALLLLGFVIHRAVYGYYRGLLDMTSANLLEICNAALLPLGVVAVLYRSEPVAVILGAIGLSTAALSTVFAVPVLRQVRRAPARKIPQFCGELLRYGTPRVPGEFGAAALTALGPMIAAHFMKITQVSPLLLGLNILMVIGYAAGPLGVVLLSKVSMMLGKNKYDEVQARLRLLLVAVMEVSVFTCIQLAVFADVVVRAWVGPAFLNDMGVIRILLLAIPPYLFFITLRSTIDAVTVKPFNTLNVLVSLGAYLVLIAVWIKFFPDRSLLAGIAGSLLSSQILLAILTVRTFRRFYGLRIPWRQLSPSIATAAALGGIAFVIRLLSGDPVPLWLAILLELVLTGAYLGVLAHRKSEWVSYMWNVGFRANADWSPELERARKSA